MLGGKMRPFVYMLKLQQKFLYAIKQNHLVFKGDSVLLGISAGPDSSALLSLFEEIQKKFDLKLIIAHFNHKTRGSESDEDEKFVRNLAKQKKICSIFGKRIKKSNKLSENKARKIRYSFFSRALKKESANYLALAHNADDQSETVLLHFLRGASIQGLAGMQYKQAKIIRPLLGCTKEEILDYLKIKKIKYRIDSSNLKTKYKRNFIRLKLLPLIKKEINPGISKTLLKTAENMKRLQNYLQQETNKAWKAVVDNTDITPANKKARSAVLNLSKFIQLNEFLQLEILKMAILKVKKNLKNIYSYHLEEILEIIKSDKKNAEKNIGMICIIKSKKDIIISKNH